MATLLIEMATIKILIFLCFGCVLALETEQDLLSFPPGFLIGTATAAYQIEGAWNISDKGENLWDHYTHTQPNVIDDRSNGDIACDSYHKYKEDIQLIKEMGLDFYRFSLSWSRILPKGYSNIISKDGVKYYHNLLDELEKYNITPMVTLYHWDHPQIFQDMGGWTNEIMVELFADYARVVFQEFGHRIKILATFNEPESFCQGFFNEQIGEHAQYLCSHNVLKAHARAYHIYNEEFRPKQGGKIGIVLQIINYWPKTETDTESREVALQFEFGIHAHPIFSEDGDWPTIVKQRVNENCGFEGLPRSRLPVFSKYWIDYIKGTADYLGLNHYTTNLVELAPKSQTTVYANDSGLIYSFDPKWPETPSNWLRMVPEGFLSALRWVKDEYNNPLVYVLENGVADDGTLKDNQRIEYFHSYIKNMLIAIHEYGCNIKGYTIWSLMDNFEWNAGYLEKFGIFQVDFDNPNRTRTPKKSVSWFKDIIRARKLLPIPEEKS